jgi:Predicted flavoprotein involved in K+ transport
MLVICVTLDLRCLIRVIADFCLDQAYLVGVAEKYGLYNHIRFNSTVEEARWDDIESKWKTSVMISGQKDSEFSTSYVLNSDFLVSAVGQLNLPQTPDIPGLKDFKGKMMHSARWDWSYDLKGKRIAIIGNGALSAKETKLLFTILTHSTGATACSDCP